MGDGILGSGKLQMRMTRNIGQVKGRRREGAGLSPRHFRSRFTAAPMMSSAAASVAPPGTQRRRPPAARGRSDRKSVVQGKSASVRVDFGGGRLIIINISPHNN